MRLRACFEIDQERSVALEPVAAHVLDLSQQDREVQLVNEERPDQLVVAGQQQIEQRLKLMLQRGVPDGQLADPVRRAFLFCISCS